MSFIFNAFFDDPFISPGLFDKPYDCCFCDIIPIFFARAAVDKEPIAFSILTRSGAV